MKSLFFFGCWLMIGNMGLGQQGGINEDSIRWVFNNTYDQIAITYVPGGNKLSVNKNEAVNVSNIGDELMQLLILMESTTEFEKEISAATRGLIATKNDPYILVLVEKAINENKSLDTRLQMKNKLLRAISIQVNYLTETLYPYYNYHTDKKKTIKFISVRTGNDLFTLAGLYDQFFLGKDKYIKDGNTFFQRNDDRDYTGSLLIEVGTDLFNTLRKRPLKTYQVLLYGFDVYTPYFRDSIIFATDTSYNILDRPHASFQYFGWSKKGISRSNLYRWETTIKFGKIGGKAGERFQNAIHQDISYSPRPKGWDAQIANGGRIGYSIEFKEEFFPDELLHFVSEDDFRNLNASVFAEQKLGTYMTTAGLGIQVSNKTFSQNNQNFINQRIRENTNNIFDHLMYKIAFSATYVKHNTMLEGYGLFSTQEQVADYLTPRSRYYLQRDQLRRINYLLNTTVSYTTRFATLFYNWKSISSETKLDNIGINSPASGKPLNIANRWQHFAELGFTFNVH